MARRKKSGKPEKIVLRALEWGWVPKNPIERDSDGEVTRWRSGAVKAGEEFVFNGNPDKLPSWCEVISGADPSAVKPLDLQNPAPATPENHKPIPSIHEGKAKMNPIST